LTKLLKALAGLLFIVAVVNAGEQVFRVYRTFQPYVTTHDSQWQMDELLVDTRKDLREKAVERIGFRIKEGIPFEQKVAPIVVDAKPGDYEWVVMDYAPEARHLDLPGFLCVEDFGKGLSLHRKSPEGARESTPNPDLGRVWHEQEGEWKGTWTRRGETDTFDAVWTGPEGGPIVDEILIEPPDCGKIVLFRKGTKGRYRGTLSKDGTRIEKGTADWTPKWSATIERPR
jgi:hypothetical protein